MKLLSHKKIEQYRIVMGGLVAVFALRVFIELAPTIYLGGAVAASIFGVLMARLTAKHFGHDHHRVGDSAIDMIPVAVLIFANIAHPAVDGFTVIETLRLGGLIAGMLFAGSVVLHEFIRQSFLIAAFEVLHIDWKWVVGTALLGISIGVATGIGGANFFHRYEVVADIATLFSYSFVIAEFYFVGKEHSVKRGYMLFVFGILIGTAITLITKAH